MARGSRRHPDPGNPSGRFAPDRQRPQRRRPDRRAFPRRPVRPALPAGDREFAHSWRLDRFVQRPDRAAAGLGGQPHQCARQNADPRHRDPLLSFPAVPHRHRLRQSVQSQCRLDQQLPARRARRAVPRPSISSRWPASCWSRCCTPSRSCFCWRRARCNRSMPPTRKRRKSSASGKWRTALSITPPLVLPAILSGTLLAFVNAIALFGSQAIIGLPARIVTLPTRIYALFDFPPEYGLGLGPVACLRRGHGGARCSCSAAFWRAAPTSRLSGKGSRPQLIDIGAARWVLFGFALLVFVVAIIAPYASLIAVSLSKSWGLNFWKGLTLANYRFILFEYDVTQRAIAQFAAPCNARCHVRGRHRRHDRLDRPAHQDLPGRKLLDYAALIPLGLPGIVMAVALIQFWLAHADRALRNAHHPAARLCRPLRPARRARGQCVDAAGRPVARRKRAHSRRFLGLHDARGDAAADPARACSRAGFWCLCRRSRN